MIFVSECRHLYTVHVSVGAARYLFDLLVPLTAFVVLKQNCQQLIQYSTNFDHYWIYRSGMMQSRSSLCQTATIKIP